jgi:predicted NUDIX family NTP pyrophosphohydrolase
VLKQAAGIVLFRIASGGGARAELEVLIAHMGGPFWSHKDEGAWSIPKGEIESDETPEQAALREFEEELGSAPPEGTLVPLGGFDQSHKHITAFALEGDLDAGAIVSNEFQMEWPRGSGRLRSYPELDRAEWVGADIAGAKLVKGQVPIVEALRRLLVAQGRIAT